MLNVKFFLIQVFLVSMFAIFIDVEATPVINSSNINKLYRICFRRIESYNLYRLFRFSDDNSNSLRAAVSNYLASKSEENDEKSQEILADLIELIREKEVDIERSDEPDNEEIMTSPKHLKSQNANEVLLKEKDKLISFIKRSKQSTNQRTHLFIGKRTDKSGGSSKRGRHIYIGK